MKNILLTLCVAALMHIWPVNALYAQTHFKGQCVPYDSYLRDSTLCISNKWPAMFYLHRNAVFTTVTDSLYLNYNGLHYFKIKVDSDAMQPELKGRIGFVEAAATDLWKYVDIYKGILNRKRARVDTTQACELFQNGISKEMLAEPGEKAVAYIGSMATVMLLKPEVKPDFNTGRLYVNMRVKFDGEMPQSIGATGWVQLNDLAVAHKYRLLRKFD